MLRTLMLAAVVGVLLTGGIVACEKEEGPAEKAGKQIDKAIEQAGEKLEEAGDKVRDATKK